MIGCVCVCCWLYTKHT